MIVSDWESSCFPRKKNFVSNLEIGADAKITVQNFSWYVPQCAPSIPKDGKSSKRFLYRASD